MIEVKFTESDFGPCSAYANPANPDRHVCRSAGPFGSQPERCFQLRNHGSGRRRYDVVLDGAATRQPTGLADDGGCAVRLGRNQPMRNLAMARLAVRDGSLAAAAFALCAPSGHRAIWRRFDEFPRRLSGRAGVQRRCAPSGARRRPSRRRRGRGHRAVPGAAVAMNTRATCAVQSALFRRRRIPERFRSPAKHRRSNKGAAGERWPANGIDNDPDLRVAPKPQLSRPAVRVSARASAVRLHSGDDLNRVDHLGHLRHGEGRVVRRTRGKGVGKQPFVHPVDQRVDQNLGTKGTHSGRLEPRPERRSAGQTACDRPEPRRDRPLKGLRPDLGVRLPSRALPGHPHAQRALPARRC